MFTGRAGKTSRKPYATMDRQTLDFYLTLFEDLDPEAFRRRFLSALLAVQHVERGSCAIVCSLAVWLVAVLVTNRRGVPSARSPILSSIPPSRP